MKNQLIVRRLVSGILQIVLGFVCVLERVSLGNSAAKLQVFSASAAANIYKFAGSILIVGIVAIVTGIIFVSTSKRRPTKWAEYTLMAVNVIVFLLISTIISPLNAGVVSLLRWAVYISLIVGLPGKHGYKNMPWRVKGEENEAVATDAEHPSQITDDTAKLAQYKKLLDDGTITAEEFEAKKKQILNL